MLCVLTKEDMDSPLTPTVPPQPSAPQPAASFNTPKLPPQPEKLLPAASGGSWGAFFGIAIIIIVLVVGALYFWGAQLEKQDQIENAAEENVNTEKSTLSGFDTDVDGFEETAE